jgi:hypothetical protein
MTATSLLFVVCQKVHVSIIVFSIIGLQVAGQKLEMLAPTLDIQIRPTLLALLRCDPLVFKARRLFLHVPFLTILLL